MAQQFSEVPKKEIERLKRTIKLLSKVFADLKIEYRIFGSIIPAAILGRPQRKLGDIDLMINLKDKARLFDHLKKEGHQPKERKLRFCGINFFWAEAVKSDLLDLTIFLGKFDKDKNFIVDISKNLKAIAYNEAIKQTPYNFYGAKFIGIPAVTGYYGTLASRGNPKRKYDLAVFEIKKIRKPPKNYSALDFYYKGKKLTSLYYFSCFLQDLLGRLNLFLGRNYDFWRR